MGFKVAVVGATGVVGHEILSVMAERSFPADQIVALASRRSAGRQVTCGDSVLTVQAVEDFDFNGTDIVFASAGAEISEIHAPRAAAAGAVVIDNTSRFRMDSDVPLIVPEVNPGALAGYEKRRIIANPNCSTIAMVMALKPLHDAATVRRVVVSTYQSVSGAGKEAMDELFNQTRKFFVTDALEKSAFTKQIAFNVIPCIDHFMDDGTTREEWKMMAETKKILDKSIKVSATCVRVPVFIGHGAAVHAEFESELTAKDARRLWRESEGITVIDTASDMEYVTPVEIAGEDDVFVSRIREDITVDNGLSFWCVSDNIRKGAALNSVQIAECLIRDYLKR